NTSTGALTPASCVNSGGTGGCTAAKEISGIFRLAITDDGKSLYGIADGLASFSINPATGALTQIGCVSTDSSVVGCDAGTRMSSLTGITVTPDGKNVYTTAYASSSAVGLAVDEFDRVTTGVDTGKLTQKSGT